ncbi:LCP family protein [Demequina sp. NBRC 110057]|uniref:LCP family protein n=1 Tax=Demequina sp. NBRC 110057 TaxID=1570346 RepID=UPI000A038A95|nr:LCP family protein [Demequina sp. NBRC 110057]
MESRSASVPQHSTHGQRRGALTWSLTAASALIALVLIGPLSYAALALSNTDTADVRDISAADGDGTGGDDADTPTNFAGGEPLNIALIGIDSREGDNAEIAADDVEGMRGDTTMVMHISADRSRIDVVSIPRDSRVQIAECEYFDGTTKPGWTGKFNEALWSGGRYGDRGEGAACVMKTITELTGVDFDGHFALVDFAGFEDMVDAIDGIPMCITEDMYSKDANLDIEAGAQVLDGETALAFARARKGTGLGGDGTDLARIERQQELLTNMARKVLGMNLLTDTAQLNAFLRAALDSLTLDTELADPRNVIGLAYSLRSFDTDNLTFYTVPWHYPGDDSTDVLWTEPDASLMWKAIVDDVPVGSIEDGSTSAPSATATATPEAAPTISPSSEATPSTTPSPERETQQDILDTCEVP